MGIEQEDIREVRHGVSWEELERFLDAKGDGQIPRITYLDGVLELVTPSRGHEKHGSWIARLVEVYARHARIRLSAFGSWLLKNELRRAGAEPDECYIIGEDADAFDLPHFVIEIQWSRLAIKKLAVYKRLGVPEVWFWKKKNVIDVHVMRDDDFVRVERSECLPSLDLVELCSFLDRPNMLQAEDDYRDALVSRAAT